MGKHKGNAFEREVCRKLSLWWTQDEKDGPRSDIFWRTSNSGGRATCRTKKGQQTKNSHGDICALDPIGQPLIDLITFEVKRGYSRDTIADILDKPAKSRTRYEEWIQQAFRSHKGAGSYSWALIIKRNRRDVIVLLRSEFLTRLSRKIPYPRIALAAFIADLGLLHCEAIPLAEFCRIVNPMHVRELSWEGE